MERYCLVEYPLGTVTLWIFIHRPSGKIPAVILEVLIF